jgi:hypothetical protein
MVDLYPESRFKHLICEASFDGWIENDGENADIDLDHVQLLKESDALKVVEQAHGEFKKIVAEVENNSEPEEKIGGLYAKMVLKRLSDYEKRWFSVPKESSEAKPE